MVPLGPLQEVFMPRDDVAPGLRWQFLLWLLLALTRSVMPRDVVAPGLRWHSGFVFVVSLGL